MKKQLVAKIWGRVQGVGFRASARFLAKRLGLVGFVRNEEDGSVFIIAEGEEKKLEEFLKWAHSGPFLAKVEKVDFQFKEAENIFKDFEIRF